MEHADVTCGRDRLLKEGRCVKILNYNYVGDVKNGTPPSDWICNPGWGGGGEGRGAGADLKVHLHEIFYFCFFYIYQKHTPGPLIQTLKSFRK
jgi:hypothetical protein